MNKVNGFSVINEKVYTNTSLMDDISFLSDIKNTVTDDKIINLIIKYFFAYRYNESINEKNNLNEINELFEVGHFFFGLSRMKGSGVSSDDTDYIQNLHYFQNNGYALSMLGDISSTTVIVKDIINRTISKDTFNGNYIGLDLGTGSAILLLAQFIQANRNNFNNIENIGFDISSSLDQSEKLVQKLGIGEIIHGDTTKEKTFQRFLEGGNITHVSNETIPTSIVNMHTISDPFCENNKAIYTSLNEKIIKQTQFFPNKIDMIVKLGDDFTKDFDGNNSNKFSIEFIKDFGNYVKETMGNDLGEDWNLLQNIYPKGIEIDGQIIPMREIGKYLIENGSIKKMEHWRDRWK